jgi:hypothetical protein
MVDGVALAGHDGGAPIPRFREELAMSRRWLLVVALGGILGGAVTKAGEAPSADPQKVDLPSYRATLQAPVLVGRSKGYLWFPTVHRLSDGNLLAVMSNYADIHVKRATGNVSWSTDGGKTWSPMKEALYGDVAVPQPNGDLLLLPYYLYPRKDGMGAAAQLVPKGKQETRDAGEVTFTGWPKPGKNFDPQLGLAGFVTNGEVVPRRGGGWLMTLYGWFEDDRRYSLVVAESDEGRHWKFRSIIAGPECQLPGKEGPCESALARLRDGRLVCVYRLDANATYGHSFSSDDGKTWTKPASLPKDVFSVQPSLKVLTDGALALSGGRPGIFLYLNAAGDAKTWEKIDLLAHHNATVPTGEKINGPGNTSSYTEVVALDERNLLVIYDRIPHSWSAIPDGSQETNSVWVVRISLERKAKSMPMGKIELKPDLQERCLEILRKGLRNHAAEFFPAVHAAEALTLAGHGGEVQQVFGPLLKSETDGKKRCGLARELYRAGDKDQAAVLLALVDDPGACVHAAESLYKIGAIGDGKALRKAYEQSAKPALRMMAAAALAKNGDAGARAFLRKMLDDPANRMYAAWALGRVGEPSDIPAIRKMVAAEDRPFEKAFGEQALATLGDPAGKAALARHLQSDNVDTRALAAESAGHAAAIELVPQLIRLLDDPVLDVRYRAAQALLMMSR